MAGFVEVNHWEPAGRMTKDVEVQESNSRKRVRLRVAVHASGAMRLRTSSRWWPSIAARPAGRASGKALASGSVVVCRPGGTRGEKALGLGGDLRRRRSTAGCPAAS